jgi:uncharacterized protein YndB with AHSA1/START domain
MAATDAAHTEAADRELVITRIFNAPREIVFKAWSEPDRLAHWLGPQGFTSTIVRMDARPGGEYCFHMRGPGGDDHWSQGVYREIAEPERIVFTTAWADSTGTLISPETIVSVTFEDVAGKTRLTLHQGGFESVAARDDHRFGYLSTLERLAEYLAAAVR